MFFKAFQMEAHTATPGKTPPSKSQEIFPTKRSHITHIPANHIEKKNLTMKHAKKIGTAAQPEQSQPAIQHNLAYGTGRDAFLGSVEYLASAPVKTTVKNIRTLPAPGQGIQVNAVAPGPIQTPLISASYSVEEARRHIESAHAPDRPALRGGPRLRFSALGGLQLLDRVGAISQRRHHRGDLI